MPESKLAAYVSKTRAWLQTERGQAVYKEARERFGYSHTRALCVAVMHATHLIVYERIEAVVLAIRSEEVAA